MALTSLKSGGSPVGIDHSRTKATELLGIFSNIYGSCFVLSDDKNGKLIVLRILNLHRFEKETHWSILE
jgi:hypothetical protein